MSARKKGVSEDRHQHFGALLSRMNRELNALLCEASRYYPLDGRVMRAAYRALRGLGELRNELDEARYREQGEDAALSAYFGRGELSLRDAAKLLDGAKRAGGDT